VAQVLVGSRVRSVLDRGLDRIPTYGKLAGVPLEDVKDLLGILADAGLVERQGIAGGRPGAFVLGLTPDGFAVARGQRRPELAFPTPPEPRASGRKARKPAEPPPGAEDVDPELLARLKRWRTEEARRRGMPPYIIFPDRTLIALAAAQPHSEEALLEVPGVGPAKLAAYGERLLQLLGSSAGAEVENSLPTQ
jgi:ATP-dependent DNA helicase RecQ